MLESPEGGDHEVDTASDQGSSGSNQARPSAEHQTVVQPLCDCAAKSVSPVVVYTCPICMGVALRAMEALYG